MSGTHLPGAGIHRPDPAKTLQGVYGHLKGQGSSLGLPAGALPIGEMHELMGFGEVWEFEKRWGKAQGE